MWDETLLIAGVLLVAAGCWFFYWPLALIISGLVLMWLALPSRRPFIDDGEKPPGFSRGERSRSKD